MVDEHWIKHCLLNDGWNAWLDDNQRIIKLKDPAPISYFQFIAALINNTNIDNVKDIDGKLYNVLIKTYHTDFKTDLSLLKRNLYSGLIERSL